VWRVSLDLFAVRLRHDLVVVELHTQDRLPTLLREISRVDLENGTSARGNAVSRRACPRLRLGHAKRIAASPDPHGETPQRSDDPDDWRDRDELQLIQVRLRRPQE
jgi:hypothetical protein